MSSQIDRTTLVCLFYDGDRAQATINDLSQSSIPESAITVVGGPGAASDALEKSALASMEMPDKDYDHLKDGLHHGGIVVAVAATEAQVGEVERIFKKHSADQIDEAEKTPAAEVAAAPLAAVAASEPRSGNEVIPITQEELVVGKRQVDMGGVRVFRRTVEVPVSQTVNLHEEHIVLERRPVNREVTASDLAYADRTIEVNAMGEEAVVAKNARVVEEVLIGKVGSERVETIHDSVRHTEVEVETLADTTNSSDFPRR